MDWFVRDFDHPGYFDIYRGKAREAAVEGPGLAACLDLPRGARVLDLPCGWGRLRPHLEARGLAVVGGDLSPLNLRRGLEEFPGPAVRLDLRALPFRDGCADGVLCAYTSWGYFRTDAEDQAQLREFARVLRPGGVLVLDLAGRGHLARAVAFVEGLWRQVREEGVRYRERVRWSPDRRRVVTDRVHEGVHFRHDIRVPEDAEVREALAGAGLRVDRAWGGYGGGPLEPLSERWIYRAVRD